MKIMKIRRVGNSNVVTLPHELEERGYVPGQSVFVEELPSGEVRLIPTSHVREVIRRAGLRVQLEDQEVLQILAKQEQAEAAQRHVPAANEDA